MDKLTMDRKEAKVYPGIISSILLLAMIFILMILAILPFSIGIGVYAGMNMPDTAKETAKSIYSQYMNLIVLFSLIVAYSIAMFYILKKRHQTIIDFLCVESTPKGFIWLPLIFASVFLSIFLGKLMSLLMIQFSFGTSEVKDIANSLKGSSGMFSALIIAPIFEEMIFRGTILNGLSIKYGKIKGLFISAIMFSLFHFNLVQLLPTFILGLCLGYLYLKTGSVIATIVCHAVYNVFPVISVQIAKVNKMETLGILDYTIMLASFVILIFCIRTFNRKSLNFERKLENEK